MLPHFDNAELTRRLPYGALIDDFQSSLRRVVNAPARQRIDATDGRELLLMPAVQHAFAGVKLLSVIPDNAKVGLPTIQGVFTLFDFRTGQPLATMDADELTGRRTAAVSALAARQLSRRDARRLLLVGSGHLIPHLAQAHAAVRSYDRVTLWARDIEKAARLSKHLAAVLGRPVEAVVELREAVMSADVISTATRATSPIIQGDWVQTGTHLDLVGGYRPDMREVDAATVSRARLFVDTKAGALSEAGDLLVPVQSGAITAEAIVGDIADLAKGAIRSNDREITLFKSVGTAAADLAAAVFAWSNSAPRQTV